MTLRDSVVCFGGVTSGYGQYPYLVLFPLMTGNKNT